MKKHIPNFITLLNLLCGCIAVLCAVSSDFFLAALFVFAGIFFDFMDGLTARLLNVKSALGLQLDSLADMITSGVVPGVVMFKLLTMSLGGDKTIFVEASWDQTNYWHGLQVPLLAFLGFLITLSSAYRLAKFNLDEDQQSYFKGLPTPANTILIISLPLILEFQGSTLYHKI
ncbi:MAG: CDP-alcohol phosphatidyltransferase family protein, partial [Mangrovimonas sp.]|nr:CDP-alcohol phosphatidyltransferase family protein [Mangrovimonas sp.]